MCNCNEPAVTRTVGKDGPNKGRQFHTCCRPQEQSCGFFQWADENHPPGGGGGFGGGGGGFGGRGGGGFGGRGGFGGGGGGFGGGAGGVPAKKKARAVPNKASAPKRARTCGLCHEPGHTRTTPLGQ
ncbi:hypothetical protein ANANG_G00295670 [Anguilla anguilla]|uniref:GRF-type domain-containing protein n=1 Tax=Anguilla anguilla TaxID=7936 RepID=A0A9D3RJY6_ANGAN|nr:hypothetical protein ANANG_G00295670 [Anguilla anguilla]